MPYVRSTGIDIAADINTYMSIKQGPHETLSDYKNRFVSYAQALDVMWERQVTKAQTHESLGAGWFKPSKQLKHLRS